MCIIDWKDLKIKQIIEECTRIAPLKAGAALKGRNSPVFAKRFWKGNK